MIYQNFTVCRGSTLQFRLNFIDADTLPDNIYLHVKNKSSDTTYILQLQLNNGIEKVEDQDSYDVYIPAIDTKGLELLNYIYQIHTLYGSDYEPIVEGKLVITPEV